LSLARGVPVLQEVFLRMLRHYGPLRSVHEGALADYFVVGAWLADEDAVVPVSFEARLSFSRAFGLSPDDQMLMERGIVPFHREGPLVEYPVFESALLAEPGLLETSWDTRH